MLVHFMLALTGCVLTCDTGIVTFDDCSGQTGDPIVSRVLVNDAPFAADDLPAAVVIIRSQADLDSFWQTEGLVASGEPAAVVDFGSEQVVAATHDAVSCHSGEWISEFYVSTTDANRLMARVSVDGVCGFCDTGSQPVLDVWATPIGGVDRCRVGSECDASCP